MKDEIKKRLEGIELQNLAALPGDEYFYLWKQHGGWLIQTIRDLEGQLRTAEIVRLDLNNLADDLQAKLEAQERQLRAQLEELQEKLPCGHRKVDNDDSYGDCVLCIYKRGYEDYEKENIKLQSALDEANGKRLEAEFYQNHGRVPGEICFHCTKTIGIVHKGHSYTREQWTAQATAARKEREKSGR